MTARNFKNRLLGARLSLTAKLFAAMVIVNILVVLAMAFAARVSFDRGFFGYLGEQEKQRLEISVAPLAAAYRAHGSWSFLEQDQSTWHELMRPFSASAYPQHAPADPRDVPRLPVSDLTGAKTRFTLVDASGHYVFGNPDFNATSLRRPVVVDGQTVGWLLMLPFRQVTETGDLRFQQRQVRASWTIAIIAIALVACITLWLARALASPLRRLAGATHKLAAGDYGARVPALSGSDMGQLEQDFNHLADTLQRNERVRRAFVADVSHELRTPLAVIRGEIEALEVGVRPLDAVAVRSLSGEVRKLNSLVDDLYDLSLADVGALRYNHIELDLAELLRDTLVPLQHRLTPVGMTLHADVPETPLWIDGDEGRILQVLSNIFENIVRYAGEGAQIYLRARAHDENIIVDIQDNGRGVPDNALASLFERFYRVEGSRSRATGGAGLGLPICRGIIEAHGGRIDAARAPQGGLWISIQLPQRESPV